MKNNRILYPVYDYGKLHVSISKGNSKMGNIPAFNLLPSDEFLKLGNSTQLTNIMGTCGKHCELCKNDCYAVRSIKLHHNSTIKGYAANTVIMRQDPDKLRTEIKEFCDKNIVKYFRFHTAGELESIEQLKTYCEICKDSPDVIFYIYTKAFDLLQEWTDKGETFPENFVINLSMWRDNMNDVSCKIRFDNNIFIYDDGSENMSDIYHCPATDKNGHETGVTCAMCRRCMKKRNVTAVYAH